MLDEVLSKIRECTNAKDLWKKLIKVYGMFPKGQAYQDIELIVEIKAVIEFNEAQTKKKDVYHYSNCGYNG